MAAVCIQRTKVPGLGSGVDCPNFRIPTLDARVFASQCRHASSSASFRIFDGSREIWTPSIRHQRLTEVKLDSPQGEIVATFTFCILGEIA